MSINPLNDISRVYLEQVAAVEEGVRPGNVETPLDKAAFKKRRRSLAGKEKSAEARKRGHEGKQWYNSGRTYSPDEAKSRRKNMSDTHRSLSYGTAESPDDNEGYPAVKTKNPKKLRKQKAMGELGESAVPGKPAEKLGAVTAIPKAEQEAARQRTLAKAAAIRAKKGIKEAAKPDYLDFDGDGNKKESMKKALKDKKKVEEAAKPNDGNLANNYPPYDKVTRGDVIAGRLGKDQMGGKKKKVTKEGFSNWRQDLCEIVKDIESDKPIKEKEVSNKIKINPKLGESVEQLGGTLLEMVEIDEVDFIVESVYDELLDEGYEEDDIEEALEYALIEAKVTYGHDTKQPESGASRLVRAVGRLARQKLAGAKKSASAAVARGARKVAKGALSVARKIETGDKKPHTVERKPSTYRGAGVGTKEKVSSGSYTPSTKKKAEKPADPWEGSATTPPKAKTKKAAAPKAKTPAAAPKRKRKSKLDDLLADIRSEQVQIDEKTLTAAETRRKEEIVKSMKSKAADFENRYPGRGKEVMYATATKMAKKVAEQAMGLQPNVQQPKEKPLDTTLDRQKFSNLRMMQQKQQQLQKQKLNLQKQGKLPLEAD